MNSTLAPHIDQDFFNRWILPIVEKEYSEKKSIEIISQSMVEAMRDGDMDAFREIYLKSYDKLKDFLTFILRNKEDAEEAVHDMFLYILENREKIDPQKKFKYYLYTVAKNMAYSQMRRRKLDEKYNDYHLNIAPDFAESADELIMTNELALMISLYIDDMPPQRRRVFELSRNEGKSISEIAEIMQLSPQTVKNYLQAATNGLRELIPLFVVLFLS